MDVEVVEAAAVVVVALDFSRGVGILTYRPSTLLISQSRLVSIQGSTKTPNLYMT